MTIFRLARIGAVAAALTVSVGSAQTRTGTETEPVDVGGRKVTLKPVDNVDFGHYGTPGWGAAMGVAGIGLLALAGLMSPKLLK